MGINHKSKVFPLDSLSMHPDVSDLVQRVAEIKEAYFPELSQHCVYLGTFGKFKKFTQLQANVDIDNCVISFNIGMKVSNVVIFHELMHLVQWRDADAPRTEEYCSISAMARMPSTMVDEDKIPYIDVPTRVYRELFPKMCKQALAKRKNGNHAYIKCLKDMLEIR